MADGLGDLNPWDNPDAYDFLEVGGVENPGIVIVEGFVRDYGWDIKKGKGTKGATLTLNEFPPSTGKFTFVIWTKEQYLQWFRFRESFNYDPPRTKTSAVDVFHPYLAENNVYSIVCKSISPLMNKGKGRYEAVVEAIEYLPPPPTPKVVTPTSSASDANGQKKPGGSDDKVADAQQEQIRKLLLEAKKT